MSAAALTVRAGDARVPLRRQQRDAGFIEADAAALAASAPPAAGVAAALGRSAVLALYDELALAPKPGLVSFADSGSHADMDARTFMRSLFALRHVFPHFTALGARGVTFPVLEQAGIAAEARMLQATAGVNTHRGAIFTLGLLCASAGALQARAQALTSSSLRQALRQHWGDALAARACRPSSSHGARAAARHGLRSAGDEAAAGLPTLFEHAWPAFRSALQRGLALPQARSDALFAAMAVLDDTNLVHRGGLRGLRHAQRVARGYLAAGGSARPDARRHAEALHREFVARRLSPGGAADVLAACCWLHRIGVS